MLSELPLPGSDAQAHSHLLQKHIAERIAAVGGWISFSDYMELALYAPGLGYYSAGAGKFGESGDFVTAPEISALFSRCLAGQCAQVLADIDGGVVLELGAGTGTMAADMLIEFDRLGTLPAEYLILEPSADLRERQTRLIRAKAGEHADRVRWLESAPDAPLRGVIVANEVADALPVERFVIDDGNLQEIGIALANAELIEQAMPPKPALSKAVARIQNLQGFAAGALYQSEVSLRLPAWVHTVSAWLEQGVALILDYGFSRSEYYLPERNSGTLRCYYRHRAHDNPLFWPGLQDITAWVDFSLLAEAAEAAGLDLLGYTTQAQFLLAAGLDELVAAQSVQDERALIEQAQGLRQLLLPGEMGESIKVMALGRGGMSVPVGMTGRDMRGVLRAAGSANP